MSERYNTPRWNRCSAFADYPGFSTYLEMCGERMRFVIDAKIERAADVPKLRRYLDCVAAILELPHRSQQDEIDGDWAE